MVRTVLLAVTSDIITVDGDRAFVVRVDAHKAEGVKPFADVKDQVTTLVKRQKAQDQARMEGEKLLTALKEGKGDDAMKAAGLTFGAVQKVQRSQQPSAFEENVYALPHPQKDQPVYGLTQDDKGNSVLVKLNAVTPVPFLPLIQHVSIRKCNRRPRMWPLIRC